MGDVLVVLGSATPPGRLRRALEEAIAKTAAEATPEVELIDLAERRIALADGRGPDDLDDDTGATIAAIEAAGAVIFATPVYRGSMTGALKNLLDQTPIPALAGKAVGLVAMGASDHHFLGAERHLRDVLAFFGAVVAPVPVYLTSADFFAGAPGERGVESLGELIVAVDSLAAALPEVRLGPAPFAARAVPKRAP